MRKAHIVTQNNQGHHPQGGAQTAEMRLWAGAKGTGQILYKVEIWPWSPRSVEQAYLYCRDAAERLGYELAPSTEEVGCDHPKGEQHFSEDGLLEWCGMCGVLICDHHLRKFGKPHPQL